MTGALALALATCVLAATAASAQAPANPPPPPGVKVGQVAPDFTARYLAPPDASGRRQGTQGVVQKVFMAQEALDPNSALEVCALLKEVK